MNLVFIGLVGSGYKKAAKIAATLLSRKYVDTDEVLVRNMKMPLLDYYTLFPVAAFQELSIRLATQLAEGDNYVIACGDSILTTSDAVSALKKTGFIVCLNRTPEEVSMDCDEDEHPLLARGRQRLFELYRERSALFAKLADATPLFDGSLDAFAERAVFSFQRSDESPPEMKTDDYLISALHERYTALGGSPAKEQAYLQVCLSTLKGLDTAFGL